MAAGSLLVAIIPSALNAQIGIEEAPLEPTILSRSPFIPDGWEPPRSRASAKSAPKKSATGYEFRGVYQLNDQYRFLVSEPRSRNGRWITIDTENDLYEVRGYNEETETLTLFYDGKEEAIKLASLEANPTPTAVSGQSRKARTATQQKDQPARRTIRPTTRSNNPTNSSGPPPPAWLQKLREEAAQRRAQAGSTGNTSQVNASGNPGTSAAPDYTPPSPPKELLEMEIPPAPEGPPPSPPPEILQRMQEQMSRSPGA